MPKLTASTSIRFAALVLSGASSLLAFVAARAAEPAQVPLTSRVSEPPPPNVMVTIDDSGSMLADFIPEGNFVVGKTAKSVNLASGWLGGFPGDQRKLGGASPTGNYLDGVVTGQKNASLTSDPVYQMQYRSPDVNAIWYNPDLRYDPWYKPDGSARMANSTPSAARWDPVIATGTFNLTSNSNYNTRWYDKYNHVLLNGTAKFYPGLYYRLKTETSDPTSSSSYYRYDVNVNGEHTNTLIPKNPARTDCAGSVCTQAEEQQNFANWFTYYRMRESFTKAAVADSLVSFKDKLRVGWGRINKTTSTSIDGVKFTRVEKGVRQLDSTQLNTVLTGVNGIQSWPSTPLRLALKEVGRYFDESTAGRPTGSPWLTDPTKSDSGKYDCRRSVNLLMTDGYYNDDTANVRVGNVDAVNGTDYKGSNPLGASPTLYEAKRPFIDAPGAYSDTLADVAMRYFVKDLDETLENRVAPVSGDIAFWQHLTQFMVGLGVKGTLDTTDKTQTIKRITDGTLNWPDPSKGSPQKIDDMWHAAVNTGGDFYSVRNVTELTTALKEAFGKAAGNEAKEAGVATVASTLVANNVKYVPKYKSVDWYGDLEAWPLGIDGKQGDVPNWRASERLAKFLDVDGGQRNLFTWDGTKAVPFTWAGMGDTNKSLVGSEDLTNYIRGSRSKEGENQPFRLRGTNRLGDFVNSPPVVVRDHVDLGYSAINDSYSSYLAAKKARTDALVVLGGNAGILHGFRASDGNEVFGFLPQTGLKELATIASKDYGTQDNYHKFFVDGPMSETDAYISTPGSAGVAWSNLVIGSMGAGGRTFFALHVPTTDPTTLDSNAVIWEVDGKAKGDGDVGYMFADFAVGKVKNGGWYAFVGNGVYSPNGNAVLLMVNLTTGVIEKRITVGSSGNNGLMGVALVKDAKTMEVVAAYAGDLRGDLWRFDFEGPAPSDWKVGFNGEPLFVASSPDGKTVQPIVSPPVYVNHTKGGRLVLFGTGRLIDSVDSDNVDVQTFYGVWDTTKEGDSSATLDSPFKVFDVDRSSLHVQTIHTDAVTNVDGGSYYQVDTTPVDWSTEMGWLADLPFLGQRVIYPSMVIGRDYVLISTIVPATKAEVCRSSTGVGYNYILSAEEGLQLTIPIIDTNGDGEVNDKDTIASGYATTSDGRDALISDPDHPLIDGDETGGKGQICDTGSQCKVIELPPPLPSPGGVTIRDRVWKQLVTPPKR
ncbi:pilus assembly protein [Ideonella sp.]|uniref:pilus assembly protein n=1 Tax=Ideonella sp. TaxID=1929293 RepID=UPI002B47BB2B|nr:PilC/PilY family type IV pilus protein [Ideonella sp.]HJV70789.1 PilC/PilY family type IV pilus protein [Ideonella sp.]